MFLANTNKAVIDIHVHFFFVNLSLLFRVKSQRVKWQHCMLADV